MLLKLENNYIIISKILVNVMNIILLCMFLKISNDVERSYFRLLGKLKVVCHELRTERVDFNSPSL